MYVTMNLNAKATKTVAENTKVCVRTVDGVVQILPTNRSKNLNLKDWSLKTLRKKGSGLRFGVSIDQAANGAYYRMTPAKYGWYSLVRVDHADAENNIVRVSIS